MLKLGGAEARARAEAEGGRAWACRCPDASAPVAVWGFRCRSAEVAPL